MLYSLVSNQPAWFLDYRRTWVCPPPPLPRHMGQGIQTPYRKTGIQTDELLHISLFALWDPAQHQQVKLLQTHIFVSVSVIGCLHRCHMSWCEGILLANDSEQETSWVIEQTKSVASERGGRKRSKSSSISWWAIKKTKDQGHFHQRWTERYSHTSDICDRYTHTHTYTHCTTLLVDIWLKEVKQWVR